MHVIIAPDRFAGALTSDRAAEAIAAGWRRAAPQDRLTLVPMADGGPGTLEILDRVLEARAGTSTQTLAVTCTDPLGRPVPGSVLVARSGAGPAARTTAYVDSSQAVSLDLLSPAERDPAAASSAGVADLLRAARDSGAQRVIVFTGGDVHADGRSATNDGGLGMLSALLAEAGDDAVAARGSLAGLPALRETWAGVDLVLATDVEAPLLGFSGTSATFAAARCAPGAQPSAQQLQDLDRDLGELTDRVAAVLPPPHDLVTGRALRHETRPGAGAAGGLGYALMLLGARRAGAVETVAAEVGLAETVAGADLVVTGEEVFDWSSLRGSVVAGVCSAALEVGAPSVVVAGEVHVGRRESAAIGVSSAYAVNERGYRDPAPEPVTPAALEARAERVARTWSPGHT